MNQTKRFLWIGLVLIATGCYPASTVPTISTIEVQVSTELPMTETSTPACMEVPGVNLKIVPTSPKGVTVQVTGLVPHEPVRIVFFSNFKSQGKRIECCPGETANENGVYEFSTGLRSQDKDVQFKDWQVQVIHSKGVACTGFVLP